MESELKEPYYDAEKSAISKALRLIEQNTNKPFNIDTRLGRIRIQKIVYLLSFFNYQPAKIFSFSMYFHGPYSPDLAEYYYKLNEENKKITDTQPADDIPQKTLNFIINADKNGVLFLEALATTLDFIVTDEDYKETIERAKRIKTNIPEKYWKKVLQFIQENEEVIKEAIAKKEFVRILQSS